MVEHCYSECHIQALYAGCHYAECHYAECRCAIGSTGDWTTCFKLYCELTKCLLVKCLSTKRLETTPQKLQIEVDYYFLILITFGMKAPSGKFAPFWCLVIWST